ncbi:hypothetical protein D3C72_546010 [compost metagenome]
MNDIGEAAAGQQILTYGEAGGADYALCCDRLQPVVAGLLEGAEVGTPVGASLPAGHLACGLERNLQQQAVIMQAAQSHQAAYLHVGGGLQQGNLVPVTLVTHLIDQEFHPALLPGLGQ